MTNPAAAPDRPLRVIVADTPEACRDYGQLLPGLGCQLAGVAHTGRELVEVCPRLRPDLVITEVDLPGLDGMAASVEINRDQQHQVPVILVAARQDGQVLERFVVDHIMAYLAKPVKPADLAAAVRLAVLRFGHYLAAVRQAEGLAQALADRKLIERAKGVLMRRAGLDEEEAFRRLQRTATDKGQKLVEAARLILFAEEAFQRPGG
jgi:two-component system, response regulator PdtaR